MASYNTGNLTPHDFEDLARDIAQGILGVRVETFTTGRDGGIDFRYGEDGAGVIIQAKHISEYSNLKSQLKKEVTKISKLKPKRYVLISSTPLTPLNKKEIRNIFGDLIVSNDDIIGRSDLNNILENDPVLAKRHYKLWFSSIEILEGIFNKAPLERSKAKYDDIQEKLKYYVATKNVNEALQILSEKNFLIISGIPGIGKTTLADLLALSYIEAGYEFVFIQSIEEAEDLFDSHKKQFFYFDDFLGRNNLKSGEDIGESKLAFFLKRISKNPNQKLVMTTREYILRQAKEMMDALNGRKVEYSTCILELEDYSRYQKAEILYNHLFHSSVSRSDLETILKDDNYFKLIDHPNYNPRLIEFITQTDEFLSGSKKNFYLRFLEILDNPQEIWKRAFENAKPASQYLLYALLSAPEEVEMRELRKQYHSMVEYCNGNQRSSLMKDEFEKSLKELDDSFIKIGINNERNHKISFKNPSVRDYLINYLVDKEDVIRSIFETSQQLTSLHNVFSTRRRQKIDDLIIFGTKIGKEKIYLKRGLHRELANIIQRRFFEFTDVLKDNPKLLLKKISQTVEFWHVVPRELKKFMRELVSEIDIESFSTKSDFEDYLLVIRRVNLDTEDRIKSVIERVLRYLVEGYADLDVARIIAFVYNEVGYEMREMARNMNLDIEKEVKELVACEAEGFDPSHTESYIRTAIEGIEEIETTFGHDYTHEKEMIERALYEDIDLNEDHSIRTRTLPADDSNTAIRALFNTL
jgi:cytidylate kinase